MARPKKERELVYKHHLHLWLTETEYEVAAENARLAKLTMSEYVRRLLAKKKVVIKYELVASVPELKKLTAEFGRIASNINQTPSLRWGGPLPVSLIRAVPFLQNYRRKRCSVSQKCMR